MDVIQNIGKEVEESLAKSVEAYFAVALVKDYSFKILDKAKKGCKVKMIVGVNLPTPVDVLKELRNRYLSDARICQSEFFHPKVYLFKLKDGSLKAYVGSANFTESGLNSNIELSIAVTDQDSCNHILNWFNKQFEESEPITDNFLAKYKDYTTRWTKLNAEQNDDFKSVNEELDNFIEQKARIEKELIKRRNKENYAEICKSRANDVEDIKKAIDYYNGFKKIDIPKFLSIGPLGQIRQSYKKELTIAASDGSLRRLFQHLCDESIPVEKRVADALEGEYKVYGCGQNIFTKIMTVHNPKKYIVYNAITKDYLESVNLQFLYGTKFPEQYRQICQMFSEICKKTNIKDFAVLDEILFRIRKGYK